MGENKYYDTQPEEYEEADYIENVYEDPTHVDEIEKEIVEGEKDAISIKYATFLRQKVFGVDVRESMARFVLWVSVNYNKLFKRQKTVEDRQDYLENRYDTQLAGNTNISEVIDARIDLGGTSHKTLKSHLDYIWLYSSQLDREKVDVNYFDSVISSVGTGGPRGIFYSLESLHDRYPKGEIGTYLVYDSIHPDGAHSYIWKVNKWVDIGVYQGFTIDKNSIYNEALIDKSVSNKKLNMPYSNFLPKTFLFKKGDPTGVQNSRRASTNIFTLKDRTVVKSEDPNIVISLYTFNENGELTGSGIGGWLNEVIIPETLKVSLIVKYVDERVIENFNYIDNIISIRDIESYISRSELSNNLFKKTAFEVGMVDQTGFPNSSRRMRAITRFKASKGSFLHFNKNELFEYSIAFVDENNSFLRFGAAGWLSDSVYSFDTDDYFYIVGKRKDNAVSSYLDRVSFYKSFEFYDSESFLTSKHVVSLLKNTDKEPKKTFFVDGSIGNDSNDGLTESSAFKTINRALSESPKNLFIKSGVYFESISHITNEINIIGIGDVVLNGADDISNNWSTFENIKKRNYEGNSRFKRVFIDNSLPPIADGSRPSFNATIWACGDDFTKDTKLKPVLTLDECKNEIDTFYFDGLDVFVNTNEYQNNFFAVKEGTNVIKTKKLRLNNIKAKFYQSYPFDLRGIADIYSFNSEASYGVTADGFKLDYSYGVLEYCLAVKNRNDGYNMHHDGRTLFKDCKGLDNYDDGLSHHENANGVVVGGEYARNGKGGIASPTYGADVSIDGVWTHDNAYGIYTAADEKQTQKVIVKNSLITDNKIAGVRNDNYDIVLVNTIFKDNKDEFYIPKEGDPDKKGKRTIY